jgi:hypothetical protein
MSKKIPFQDFSYEFEVVFDKEKETTIQKIKRWISKRKPPLNIIFMHLFSYVEMWYWEGKLKQTMSDVDNQIEDLHELWDNEHSIKRNTTVEIEPSEVPHLPTLRIKNEVVDRGSEEPISSVETIIPKNLFPDPWDGDWNDGAYIHLERNK